MGRAPCAGVADTITTRELRFLDPQGPKVLEHQSHQNDRSHGLLVCQGSAPLLSRLFHLPRSFALSTTARCALSPSPGEGQVFEKILQQMVVQMVLNAPFRSN